MFKLEILYKQLEQNCFKIYFYPQYEAASSKIIRAKAVPQYNSGEIVMSYQDFSAELETKELIGILDIWLLDRVCQLQKRVIASQSFIIPIDINISVRTLFNPYYVYDIALILRKYDLPQDTVQFAIVSTVPYMVTNELHKGLLFLKRQGIKLAFPCAQEEFDHVPLTEWTGIYTEEFEADF